MDFDNDLLTPSENIVLVSDFPSTLENGKVYVKAEVKL